LEEYPEKKGEKKTIPEATPVAVEKKV